MNFAYADPPYKGLGKALYGHLITKLQNEFKDGWALSALPRDIPWISTLAPEARICAWVRTDPPPWDWPIRSWEPLFVAGGRKHHGLRPRDALVARGNSGEWAPGNRFRGSKPAAFNRWVLDLLGYTDDDTITDLFPGTGGLTHETSQRRLHLAEASA